MATMRGFDMGLRRSGAPVTLGLIGAMATTFLLAWFGLREVFGTGLAFETGQGLARPWTLFTYPFASLGSGRDLIWTLILWLVLFWFGGSIEREAGWSRLVAVFGGGAVLGALSLWGGSMVMGAGPLLMGASLPVAAIIMAWSARNAEATILLFLVIPFKGKYLGILTLVLTLFGHGTGAPLLGVCAIVPLVVAWLWASGRLGVPFAASVSYGGRSRGERKREERRRREYISAVKDREKEREEKERLRKLFERSLIQDPDEKQDPPRG